MALVLKPSKNQAPLGFQLKFCIHIAFLSRVFLIQYLIFLLFYPFHIVFSPLAARPNGGHSLLIVEAYRSHTTKQRTQYNSPGRVIGSSQRPLPDKTQHSQQADIHAPGEIRTRTSSKLAAVEPRLRSCVHWDRPFILY